MGGSNLNGNINAGGEIQFLELIDGFGGGLNNVDQPLMSALFESFLGFLVRVRRTLNGEPLDPGRERDGTGDACAGAFDGVRDVAGGLVDDAMVKGLQSNANTLSSHTKNNCLLMVSIPPADWKAGVKYSNGVRQRNRFFEKFLEVNRERRRRSRFNRKRTHRAEAVIHGVRRQSAR